MDCFWNAARFDCAVHRMINYQHNRDSTTALLETAPKRYIIGYVMIHYNYYLLKGRMYTMT